VKAKVEFVNLGIEFRAVESDDLKLVNDTEEFLNDLMSDRRKGDSRIINEAAYRAHLKRKFIKGELSGFEEWRMRRNSFNVKVISLSELRKKRSEDGTEGDIYDSLGL
jgi:hypothetical protein